MQENEAKKGRSKLFIIALILFGVTLLMMYMSYKNGINVNKNNSNMVEYETLSELKSNLPFEVNLPDFVKEEDKLQIKCTMGNFIEIVSDKYVLKMATFVDNNADPLALYDRTDFDNKYTVNNSSITYLRIRKNYKEYEHCTLINWVDGEVAYGLIWADIVDLDNVLITLNLKADDLVEYTEGDDSSTTDNEDSSFDKSSIKLRDIEVDNIRVTIPQFESNDFTYVDLKDMLLFSINDRGVFVIIYKNAENHSKDFEGQGEIITDKGMIFRYADKNPFDEGTDSYKNYEVFLKTVDDIAKSITYTK